MSPQPTEGGTGRGGDPRLRWFASPAAQRVFTHVRRLIQIAILGFLAWRIWQLGWREVLRSLPSEPLFYLIGFALFAAVPLSEVLAYRRIFPLPAWRGLSALLRKRTYNKEVLGYSGEIYFYYVAWRELGIEERTAFHAVKNNNIISSFCSTLWALAVLAAVLASGAMPVITDRLPEVGAYLLIGSLALALVALVLIFFRRRLLGGQRHLALRLGAIHLGRLALVNLLRIAQWTVVIPMVPLRTWIGLLVVEIVVTRLPMLPGKDLLFAGAMVELAPAFGVPTTPLLAMLVAQSALDRVLNLLVFLLPGRRPERDAP